MAKPDYSPNIGEKDEAHPNLYHRNYLRVKDAAKYLGISIGYLYQLIHQNKLTYYKPNGKLIYFLVGDLDKYILRNRISSTYDLNEQALSYLKPQQS